jgi:rhamnosyltransferase subunit B
MNLLLAPFGSSGDVNPFVGIGARMHQRGHRVTVIANEHYSDLVESEGLEFVASSTEEEYQRLFNHPDL